MRNAFQNEKYRRNNGIIICTLLAAFLISIHCSIAQAQYFTLQHDGLNRSYYVHVPFSYDGSNPYPLLIGLHALDEAEMSSKALSKIRPKEEVGNFCLVDGKVTVIEYSDLPDELAEKRTTDGSLVFELGSIGIHIINTSFVERLNEEFRRRTRVIRVFPNEAACIRMISVLAVETNEEWMER